MAAAPTLDPTIIATLRGMIKEPSTTPYTDDALWLRVLATARMDQFGVEPYDWLQRPAAPPLQRWEPSWFPTYDLNAVAGAIWSEKAAQIADEYDYTTDGDSFSVSKAHEQAMKMARFYNSRRKPTVRQVAPPKQRSQINGSES